MSFDVCRKTDVIEWKFEWKIYDLQKHLQYMNHNQFLTSKSFYNPRCPSVVWEMRAYPMEYCECSKSYGKVSLLKKSCSNVSKVIYNIYALDADFKRVDLKDRYPYDFKDTTETFKVSVNLPKTIHSDGSILLYCEVEFIPYDIPYTANMIGTSIINTNKKQPNNMYKLGINTDCVITINSEKIHLHRCVLASNSEVFQKMFEQKGMIEEQNGEINIVDSSPECVHAMIDYFYNGEINKEILEKLVYELFAIAHKYEVKSLMDICEQMMSTQIGTENFMEIFKYLNLYELPIVEKACIKYIAARRMTFLDSNVWKNFKKLYMDKANYFLELVLKKEF